MLRLLAPRLGNGNSHPNPYHVFFIDVSGPRFYAVAVRDVYTQLPEEDPERSVSGRCAKLEKTMYGVSDAADPSGDHYAATLI